MLCNICDLELFSHGESLVITRSIPTHYSLLQDEDLEEYLCRYICTNGISCCSNRLNGTVPHDTIVIGVGETSVCFPNIFLFLFFFNKIRDPFFPFSIKNSKLYLIG